MWRPTTRFSFAAITLVVLMMVMSLNAALVTDTFDRSTLGTSWTATPEYSIVSGRLNSSATANGWQYMAVYNTGQGEDPNQAVIHWPTLGNGVEQDGPPLGGIAVVNSFSPTADGYLIYLYGGSVRLYTISSGTGGDYITDFPTDKVVEPGDEFSVQWDAAAYSFTVLLKKSGTSTFTELGTFTDDASSVSLPSGSVYAGIMLHGSGPQKDVEAFSAGTATTGGGGGTGGGSTGGSAGYSCLPEDTFDWSGTNENWQLSSNQSIVGGELAVGTGSGWDNIAVHQAMGATAVQYMYSAENSTGDPFGGYLAAGPAILVDNSNPSSANGVLLYRKDKLLVYQIAGGALQGQLLTINSVNASAPQPGDYVRAEVTNADNGGKDVKFFVGNVLDAEFNIPLSSLGHLATTDSSQLYVGVLQYSGSTTGLNNIDNFQACFPGVGGAENMVKDASDAVSGDRQSGAIGTVLPNPIQVTITSSAGVGVEGVAVDFQTMQGLATFPDIENYVFDGKIWREVESGRNLLDDGRFMTDDPAASGEEYYTTQYVSGLRGKTAVEIPVYIPSDGNYDIWLRYKTDASNKDRLNVTIDDEEIDIEDYVSVNNYNDTWSWFKVGSNEAITQGSHTVNLNIIDPGWDWDKILVQSVGSAAPAGTGGDYPDFPNVTDANGIASTRVQFGTDATQDVIINVSGSQSDGTPLNGSPAVFTLYPQAGAAYKMNSDHLNPTINSAQQENLVVDVADQYDNPVEDHTVYWQVISGPGTLDGNSAATNANGESIMAITVDATADQNEIIEVKATSNGLQNNPLTFTITVGEGAQSIEKQSPIADPIESRAGQLLAVENQPTVIVKKADGTAFEGYPVLFVVTPGNDGAVGATDEPNPTLKEVSIKTDANGLASVNWLIDLGANQLEARAPGLTNSPIVFNATGSTGDPSVIEIVSGNSQTGYLGLPLDEPFVAKVSDSNGFVVSNVQVRFEKTAGTGAFFNTDGTTSIVETTDANGIAQATLTLGSVLNEPHSVSALVVGFGGISSATFTATPTQTAADTIAFFKGNGVIISTPDGGYRKYQEAIVLTALADSFQVKVFDPFGNAVENQDVKFKVIEGGGSFNENSEVTVKSDEYGIARAKLKLGTLAGDSAQVVHATAVRTTGAGGSLKGSPIVFKATGLSTSAEKLVKWPGGDAQSQNVNVALVNPVKIKVVDLYENGIKDHPVTFTLEAGNGTIIDNTNEVTTLATTTDDSGFAAVVWKMPQGPGQVFLNVAGNKPGGGALVNSPVQFTATATSDAADKMTAESDTTFTATVGSAIPEQIAVKIVDQYENPVANVPVTFDITSGGGAVDGETGKTVQTGANGIAGVIWTMGTESGLNNNVVEASASVPNNPMIRFRATTNPSVADSLADSEYNPIGKAGAMVESGPMQVRILDRYGNGVVGHSVTFTVTDVGDEMGYVGIPGQLTQQVDTGENGIAQVNWYLGPNPGVDNNKLVATSKYNNINLKNSPFEFVVSTQANAAAKLVAVTDTTGLESITTNNLQDGLEVQVTDNFGNAIANHEVTFEVLTNATADGGTLDGDVDIKKTKTTNANGLARVEFTLGAKAGKNINQVRATAKKGDETHLQGSPTTFYITGNATNADSIAMVDGNGQSGTVGEVLGEELQVAAKDKWGNNVPGQPITFTIQPVTGIADTMLGKLGDSDGPQATVVTGADGIARVQWRLSHVVGVYTVTAESKSSGDHLKGSPLTFTATANAGASDAAKSTVQASPLEQVVSGGDQTVQIIVTLKDKFDNPVKDKIVFLEDKEEYDFGFKIIQPKNKSNDNGIVTGFISSEKAGEVFVFARDASDDVNLADSAKVVFTPANAAILAQAPGENGDGETGNKGTELPGKLKVIVTDSYSNPIAGYSVNFKVESGNGEILEPQPVNTDSNGIAQSTLVLGTDSEINIVKVYATGLSNSPVQFTAIGVTATNFAPLVLVSGNNQSATPANPLAEELVVKLVDMDGRPIYGQNIEFKMILGGGTISSGSPVQTDKLGLARATATVGDNATVQNTYTATVVGHPNNSVRFTATTTGGSATKLEMVSGSGQTRDVGEALYQQLTVKTVDSYGNAVGGVQVKFQVVTDGTVDGAGTLQGGTLDDPETTVTVPSNAQGLASVHYTLGKKAGLNQVRASAPSLTPTQTFKVYGKASFAFTMEKYSGDRQKGSMGELLWDPIRVVFKDRYGNPTAGGAAYFSVTSGNGEITSASPAYSDSTGQASAIWKLGPRPNTTYNEVLVSSTLGSTPYTETFTATGDDNYLPKFTFAPIVEAYEGQVLTIPIKADDQDGEFVSIDDYAAGVPDSANFGQDPDGNLELSWNISYNTITLPETHKEYEITFYANDGNESGRTKQTMKLIVYNVNRAPVLTNPTPNKTPLTKQPGESVTFSIEAEDQDGDEMSLAWYQYGNIPTGVTGNTFTWDIDETFTGLMKIKVVAFDGDSTSFHEWHVTVLASVELSSFTSNVKPYQGAILDWATATEKNNQGFNIFRSLKEDGEYEKINADLVASRKDRQYRFVDTDVEAGTKYYYKLQDVAYSGNTNFHGPVVAEVGVPEKFDLSQNYPNPFNPTTSIRFSLPRTAEVKLEIYNIMGQRVRTLLDDSRKAGYHVVMWNGISEAGTRVGSGIYYYRIISEDYVQTKKMILLK